MSGRRRKLLVVAVTLIAGGYVSYRIYNSPWMERRRKRVLQILRMASALGEAAVYGAESARLLSCDLKDFLLSDVDQPPQSLRQLFKLGTCKEFQHSLTLALVAALSAREHASLLSSSSSSSTFPDRYTAPIAPYLAWKPSPPSRGRGIITTNKEQEQVESGSEETVCRDIPEIQPSSVALKSRGSILGGHKIFDSATCCGMEGEHEEALVLGSKESGEGLLEKFAEKLFSEEGVRFASSVVGSATQSAVVAVLDHLESSRRKEKEGEGGLLSQRGGGLTVVETLCDERCKSLLVELMREFVGTVVSVYVDKTQDVNVYRDMVDAVTSPDHQLAMKDLLMSMCNTAVDTLIRTSYAVRFAKPVPEESTLPPPNASHDRDITDLSSPSSKPQQSTHQWVEEISTTLAVPSNRRLMVDVAGTVTSEAVRSLFDVSTSTVSNYISGKASTSSLWFKQQITTYSHEARAKALLVATFCLAICLHVLAGVHVLDSA